MVTINSVGFKDIQPSGALNIFIVPPQSSMPSAPSNFSHGPPSYNSQPRANFVAHDDKSSQNWLLDSGASHHVTTNFNNLSLHSAYEGLDDMMVGNGKHLNITHTGSLNLPSPSKTFMLSNVFCVPDMKQNLISVSKFCKSNNVSVEFSHSLFIVKVQQVRAPLL